jgi:hypothetical protein
MTWYWPGATWGPEQFAPDKQSTCVQSACADWDQLVAKIVGLVSVAGHPVFGLGLEVQVGCPEELVMSTSGHP